MKAAPNFEFYTIMSVEGGVTPCPRSDLCHTHSCKPEEKVDQTLYCTRANAWNFLERVN